MVLHGTDVIGKKELDIIELEMIKALHLQGFYAIMKKSQKSRICLSERVPELEA